MTEAKASAPVAGLTADRRASASNIESPRRLNVAELLGEATEIILVHNGADYRLRITAANKLILTK